MRVLRAQRVGFTLVELLVVIAIIVVLMAIAIPVFNGARERARQTACMANLHQIAQAIRMYRMEEGAYPGPADPLTGQGGMNALYPTYISSRKTLLCPDDPITSAQDYLDKREFASGSDPGIPYRDLLTTYLLSASMYMWQDPAAGKLVDMNSTFANTYSSYNRYYNYLGYTNKAGDFRILNHDVTHRVNAGENIAFIYQWYRYNPQNKINYAFTSPQDPTCHPNFQCVDRTLHLNLARQIYWWDYPNNPDANPLRLQDSLGRPLWDYSDTPDWYPDGLPTSVFTGLINRNAPDNTIVTRCPHHHKWTVERVKGSLQTSKRTPGSGRPDAQRPGSQGPAEGPAFTRTEDTKTAKDIVLRLDGSAALMPVVNPNFDWAIQPEQSSR